MNTREKIDKAADPALLCLHKEGIFYKLYNQHAMVFVRNIKELQVRGKFIKTVNQDVYSVGFPGSIIEDIKKRLIASGGVIEESADMMTVSGITWQNENNYHQWCEQHKEKAEAAAIEKKSPPDSITLEKQIAGFQVMRKTPMDAMNFIIELQAKLNNADA